MAAAAKTICGTDETPLVIEPLMLLAKVFFLTSQIQKGIEQMNNARKFAIKFYKDDLTKYLDFQIQFVTNAA